MSERRMPMPDEQPLDLATIAADDLLLDTLGRGEAAAAGDPVADLLTAWRADLGSEQPDADAGFRLAGVLAAEQGAAAAVSAEGPVAPAPARARRWRRLALGVAAAAVALAGLSVAANRAGPDSPLWPITRVVYPEHADVRAAERAITLARTAAAEGRFDDARRLLDDATEHVAQVRDPAVAQRLRGEIDAIRRSLPDAGSSMPGPSAPASPTPAAKPGPSSGAQPGGQPAPGLPSIDPPELPLPPLPLPQLPLPTPSLPGLPLPLPSGGILGG